MKTFLVISCLFTFSSIICSEQPRKKRKPRIPLIQRLWQLCDLDRAVTQNKVLIVEDYLETHKLDSKKLNLFLHRALDSNAVGSVALLLRHGAPVNMPDFTGELALVKMTKQENIPMIIWLRAMYADPDKDNHEEKSAHEIAHEKFIKAEEGSSQQEIARNILVELELPSQLTCTRRHRIQVPEELWQEEDIVMTDIT